MDPNYNPMIYLVDKARENGVITGSHAGPPNIIRLMPPLIIKKEDIDEGLNLLEKTIKQTMNKFDLPKTR